MNTIWGFGDSFTFGYGCRPDGPLPEYYNQYRKEGDKTWLEWLGEWNGMKTENKGSCGVSNDYIFDSVIGSYNNIESGDIVVIGTTLWGRRDIPINDRWLPVLSGIEARGEVIGENTMSIEDRNTIVEFQLRFGDNPLWKKRWETRFQFLKEILQHKGVRTLIWNIEDAETKEIERITNCSPYDDGHYSFRGHKVWGEYLMRRLKPQMI